MLSAEAINVHSPYKVIQVDELSVRFCTNYGVKYMVGFTPDAFIFDENGFDFYIISETEPSVQDPLVFQTVLAIIENLFEVTNDAAMIYICAPDNDKQAVRARLFKMWFEQAKCHEDYTLKTYDSIDAVSKTHYFYGLILRTSNPNHDRLIDIFLDFLSDY